MRAVIFGTGDTYQRYKDVFRNMEIVGFIDNNETKWGTMLDGYPIFSPVKLSEAEFDYVFLVSASFAEMRKQLRGLGIPEQKMIDKDHLQFFDHLVETENFIFPANTEQERAGKRILLLSHSLDLTGAPVALCQLAGVLKHNGCGVTVYAEKNAKVKHGELLYKLLEEGISVSFFTDLNALRIVDLENVFDLFWVNTITLCHVVEKLLSTGKRVYWWLHEADDFYRGIGALQRYPHAENLYVYSAGWIAGGAYERFSGNKITGNLLYGISDGAMKRGGEPRETGKVKFGLVGAYSERKGQDIFYSVISAHAQEWMDGAEFLFIGAIPQEVKDKYEKIPAIHCLGEVSPDRLARLYDDLDVLVCPSKYDPMPVVVSEAMQHKRLCLVTNKVGQSRYMTDGVNGLICEAENEEALAGKIAWILQHREEIGRIGERGYAIYKDHFSMDIFEKNVLAILKEIDKGHGGHSSSKNIREQRVTCKMVLWGTGAAYNRVRNALCYLELTGQIEIVGITAKQLPPAKHLDGYRLLRPGELSDTVYDYIFVLSDRYYSEIVHDAVTLYGIARNRLLRYEVLLIPELSLQRYFMLYESQMTILSNNCWGGMLCKALGMECRSPLKNLFLTDEDYLKLLSDLKFYFSQVPCYKRDDIDVHSKKKYPVLGLCDIEIHCNHASGPDEAIRDWMRRVKKVNYNNLFCEMYTENRESAVRFRAYKQYEKRICFVPWKTEEPHLMQLKLGAGQKEFWEAVNSSAALGGNGVTFHLIDLLLGEVKWRLS